MAGDITQIVKLTIDWVAELLVEKVKVLRLVQVLIMDYFRLKGEYHMILKPSPRCWKKDLRA